MLHFALLVLPVLLVPATAAQLPYCNAQMETGIIPPLANSSGAELVQVQIMVRHGARTPATKAACWPGDETQFDCRSDPTGTVLFDGATPSASVFRANGWESERLFGYNQSYVMRGGSCLQGQLVASGYRMHNENGRHMRDAYVKTSTNPQGLLPAELGGNADQFYLRADSTPPAQRTKMSGEALFGSMYPGAGKNALADIPICNNAPNSIPFGSMCSEVMAILSTPPEIPFISAEHTKEVTEPLMRKVAALTNKTLPTEQESRLPLTNTIFLEGAVECSWARLCETVPAVGRSVPQGILNILPELVDEVTLQLTAVFNNSKIKKFGTGPILRDLVVGAEAAVSQLETARKFIMYSGHDIGPIMNVWTTLGIGPGTWAPFASVISFELYKMESGEHAMRIVTNGVVQQLVGSTPDGLVGWKDFRTRFLDPVIPNQDQGECPEMFTPEVLKRIHNCTSPA
eukprot:TRINITY_DN26370_c0_g1_i1.p1 TRINITY_DN26370_c0_g1~~TRINITY_DN26370_c0_g1_i1.p1  ORF type:complete len:459 (-),score=86.90 TRINITY_DN26370_c0_g1_i1:258-1634(-)